MGIIVGVIVAIVIAAAVGYFLFGKKSDTSSGSQLDKSPDSDVASLKESESSDDEAGKSESKEYKSDVGTDSESSKKEDDTEDEEESVEDTPEGVRLDESAEQEAEESLKKARRERKLKKLRQGLSKTRGGMIDKISALFKGKKELDPNILDSLEETLLSSDIGSATTLWLIEIVKGVLDKDEIRDPEAIWEIIKQEVENALSIEVKPWTFTEKPFVIMVVGVNGAGKTTTIGKIASALVNDGKKVVLAAADTFRAAAVNQLEIWGRRTGCEVVKPSKEGADPSSVVFDAMKQAEEQGADVVIIDTAGRLHTQSPLMEELKKISRVTTKAMDSAPHETLLVLDATTGQNAIKQVKEFGEALKIDSIALTKLDGTAKGGVIIGICHENKIPVRYIGIGETRESLRLFNPGDFVDALFLQDSESE
ncbi:MAG: signal recognition particle-docking protein FtsY [Deltaproteobacteria bacterium]|nr:signal recognition particle-docking protein FtsY [Deltaproteobacteria bacterium]